MSSVGGEGPAGAGGHVANGTNSRRTPTVVCGALCSSLPLTSESLFVNETVSKLKHEPDVTRA